MIDQAAPAENPAPPAASGFLDRRFRLSERATSIPQELIAGATTFAAMAYIIAVNPAIMSNAGMDRGDLVIATALVLVGVLMMQGLARIDMTDLVNAVPIVLTLLVTVLTNNLINGMALGTLSYIALEVAVGRRSQIPAMVWGLGVVFVAYAIVTAQIF